MFVFLSSKKKLIVKLPRDRVDELTVQGIGEHWDAGRGRPLKEWLVLRSKSKSDWLLFARESMEYILQTYTTKKKNGRKKSIRK